MPVWLIVVLIIVAVLIIAGVILYRVGTRMQRKQVEQKKQLDAMAQTVSVLVIDKKIMRLRDVQLPKNALDQTPKRYMRSKVPVVKAKIGPRIVNLLSQPDVYDQIPVKAECKIVLSGLYVTAIKSVRGGSVLPPPKKGRFARFRDRVQSGDYVTHNVSSDNKNNKKNASAKNNSDKQSAKAKNKNESQVKMKVKN